MKKCDVIIPVYKSPEWVKLCVYSLFKNTKKEIINNVFLINDCTDELTINCLNNLKEKYSQIVLLQNKENLGFVKTSNRGMRESTADYVLLLNTDCILAKNAIEKLINHCENNKKIGLICPISSNAANLTLEMFPGFSFMDMNSLLEKKFLGKSFDACTVVGNCLMITKECIKKTGYLDEIYGMGYGEETDYQFAAMKKGFEAKVAIDTYVFHKSEASFGNSKEKQERQAKNAKMFFDRWGNEYYKLMEEYKKNDPIEYILKNITEEDKKLSFNFLIYLIGFAQTAGGIHMSTDMVNYLIINGISCNIVYSWYSEEQYNEILLFKPFSIKELDNFKFDKLVSTFNTTTYFMKSYADKYNVPLIYFAQGYEICFYNGKEYGIAELSYKLPDRVLTVSEYLKGKYKSSFGVISDVISNGINYDLLYKKNQHKKAKTVTFMLRNDFLKGDFLLLDIVRLLMNECSNIEINIMYNADNIYFPVFDNNSIKVNLYKGPLERKQIADILQSSDIFVDASLTEGFGLMALEALASGCVVVVSDSGGINEYLKDGVGGYIIKEVNNVSKYVEKIKLLLNDDKEFQSQLQSIEKFIKNYDYDYVVSKYIDYFKKKYDKKKVNLSLEEKNLYNAVLDDKFRVVEDDKPKKLIYKICKKVPSRIRNFVKKLVAKLYHFTNAT